MNTYISAHSVCYNPCVGPLPRIKISFFLLSISIDKLISTPKIILFLTVPPLKCEKHPCLSNLIPYPEYLYLSIPAFLINLAAPTKQFSSAGYLLILKVLLIL